MVDVPIVPLRDLVKESIGAEALLLNLPIFTILSPFPVPNTWKLEVYPIDVTGEVAPTKTAPDEFILIASVVLVVSLIELSLWSYLIIPILSSSSSPKNTYEAPFAEDINTLQSPESSKIVKSCVGEAVPIPTNPSCVILIFSVGTASLVAALVENAKLPL